MKMHKITQKMISALLVLVMAALAPVQALAAANGNDGKYVSEVYVAYGKNEEQAKKALEDKGYTPVEGDLNDGGETYVMMGYKTTNNIRDAITDLAAMNMKGNFSVEDYKILLKNKKTEIAGFVSEFMAVIQEYRVNYKAGKKNAMLVHDMLNNYIDDDTGMKMGDLFNSETLQDKVGVMKSIEAENPDKLPDLVTIFLQANVQVIKSMELLLSLATDTADNTWIDRFAELDYDSMLDEVEDERPDLNTESKRKQYLENLYGYDARIIGTELQDIREKLAEYAEMTLHLDTATKEEIKAEFGDTKKDVSAKLNTQEWIDTGATYEALQNYEGGNYEKGELLELFLSADDPEDEEIFIPMAAALSDGQRYGLQFVNLDHHLRYAFASDEVWDKMFDEYKSQLGKPEDVSVYANIDRGLYADDGSVALTDSAQRANNTADGTTGDDLSKMDTLSRITLISYIPTAIFGVITLASYIEMRMDIAQAAWDSTALDGVGEWDSEILKLIKDDNAYKNYADSFIGKDVRVDGRTGFYTLEEVNKARGSINFFRIVGIITVVLLFINAVLTVIELCRDVLTEQLPIPKYMVDNYTDSDGGSYSLNYKAVECNRMEYFGADYKRQKGDCADLLADRGKQWVALYATKNSKAGRPLTPDFIIQQDSTAPKGYEANVHLFGEKAPINIVCEAFKMYSLISSTYQAFKGDYTVYVFAKRSKDVKTYDEASGNMTASAIGKSTTAIFGFGGLALGAVIGVLCTVFVGKSRKKKGGAK